MTSSLLDVRRGSQTPRVANYPPYDLSAAPEVIDLAASAGLHLDPWQEYVLTHGLGMTAAERWTAPRVSVWVPRQNGKGGIIEALELAWLFLFEEELIIHSAHQHRTSQTAYDRLERIIRRTPHLHRKVASYRQANGEQEIELRDGRKLQYTTRSRTAVRGFSAKKIVLDEAQELNSEQMAAMMPTVSAMDNWQVWHFGTPPSQPTAWAYNLREDGKSARPRLAHFDWGIDFDPTSPEGLARAADPETAYQTNPALGIRIAIETVEDENTPSNLGALFAQERLGYWQPRASGGAGVISEEVWRGQVDRSGSRPTEVALAIQVNYRRTHTAIVAVGARADGGRLVSVVDYRPGTHWVVDRAVTLKERWDPIAIAIQDKGPTGSLLEDMAKVGLKPSEVRDDPRRGDIAVPWADDVADAYGMFVDATLQRRLWHLDEAPLNLAIASTETRALSGGTAWDYKGDVDSSTLQAATLGLWVYETRAHLVRGVYDPLANIF